MEFVRDGAVQRILDCELIVQASRDCVNKLVKRLQDRMHTRTLNQILYIMQARRSGGRGQGRGTGRGRCMPGLPPPPGCARWLRWLCLRARGCRRGRRGPPSCLGTCLAGPRTT